MCPLEIPFQYYLKTRFHSKIILWFHSRHKGYALVSLSMSIESPILLVVNAVRNSTE